MFSCGVTVKLYSKFVVLLLVGAVRAALGTAEFHNTESRSGSGAKCVRANSK